MPVRHWAHSKAAFRASLVALLLLSLLQVLARRYPHVHPDLVDGFRGLLLGIVIGTLVVAAGKNRRRTANGTR